MTALIASFLASKIGVYVAGAVVAFAAILGTYLRGRSAGKKMERQKRAAEDRRAIDDAQAIDDAIAGRSPDKNRDALKRWSPK